MTKKSINAQEVLQAVGGAENLQSIDACLTRLRVTLINNRLLKKQALKTLGAVDVVVVGNVYQIIFGEKSAQIRDDIKALLNI